MLFLSGRGKNKLERCLQIIEEEPSSSRSQELFKVMFESQGGNWSAFIKAKENIPKGYRILPVASTQSGFVRGCDALKIGEWVQSRGGGRRKVTDVVDHRVGVVLRRKQGDAVEKGDVIAEAILKEEDVSEENQNMSLSAFEIGTQPTNMLPLIVEVI